MSEIMGPMFYGFLADVVLVVHFVFVLFSVSGGFLALKCPRIAWLHIPVAVWAVLVELAGWICPLTPLEHWLRTQAGATVEEIGFIEQYLVPILYPTPLTRPLQMALGGFVLGLNALIYGWILCRGRQE